jgi:GPI mannosyltransferase 3
MPLTALQLHLRGADLRNVWVWRDGFDRWKRAEDVFLKHDGKRPLFGVSANWTMAAILALALSLRVLAIFSLPSLHHPDENFQMLEQAHRLAFGYGVVPWEFQYGMRSLVVPYLLSKVFGLTEPLFGGPEGYIHSAQVLLAGLSLIGVAAVYRMGLRISSVHAFLLGLVAATWFEMIYFSFRPLSEGLSWNFMLVALALASVQQNELSWRRLIAIGLAAGLSLMLRIHLAPGLAFLAIWICRLDFRNRWTPMLLGGAVPVIVFGLADWIAWGSPFHSFIAYVTMNVFEGKASTFSTAPFTAYVIELWYLWSGAFPVILALIIFRARASVLWLAVAVLIIASHSLIPHKEYRFVFPAFACLVLVAAMASADIVERFRRRSDPLKGLILVVTSASLWIATSASLAFAPAFARSWFSSRGEISSESWLSKQPDLCGLLIYGEGWWKTGGYAYLHRNVPLYYVSPDMTEAARPSVEAYNYVLLPSSFISRFQSDFPSGRCAYGICVLKRNGSCHEDPTFSPLLTPAPP